MRTYYNDRAAKSGVGRVRVGGTDYDLQLRYIAVDRRFSRTTARVPRIHAHALYHLVVYTRGANTVVLDGVRAPVGPYSLAIVSPGSRHDLEGISPGELEYSEMTIAYVADDGRRLTYGFAELLAALLGTPVTVPDGPIDLAPFDADRLRARFLRLLTMNEFGGRLQAAAVSVELLSLFVDLVREYVPRDAHPDLPPPVERARRFVDERYRERLRLADIAAEAGVCEEYLIRLFTRHYGTSPMRYVRRRRLDAAATLLADTSLSVGEIAVEVGYTDLYQFSHAFKAATGNSPRVYRREVQEVHSIRTS